ncbi:hypothetical protein Taro_051022 [Colocasia esculenta]|uniref:Uncharacterized protein n=1 Tax=Colocasia esculenta TaxID=4460 RepID=A0A843XFD5_COLES|nr:hypothetical protein [Colocasia esculenta]
MVLASIDVDVNHGSGAFYCMNLAARDVDAELGQFGQTRALFFPHSLLSTSPTFTLELLREFCRSVGARGKAVVRVVAADRAGNGELERDVRGAFLGCGVGWPPQLFDFFLVERQLDLSSVTARLRGCSCVVLSGCVSYPLRDFSPFAGGGSGYGALLGISTPVRHTSAPFLIPIIQKLYPFKSMAASGVSGSIGGYGAVFLTVEQQERFTTVKIKVCGNKAVDVADLQKNGMGNIIAAMERMKWSKMATLSEVSYPDLVKAFFVCLKTEEDGSLTSTVKGTQIKITYELLESLFGVRTTGHNGVHNVDIQAKGLGIVGREYKLKDGKIDINQLNAFYRLLHFIVCQILIPKSATFSTCTKADLDMTF